MYKNVYKYDDQKRGQHMAVRTTAGWYLFTHQLLEVSGPDAAGFLDHMLPKPIATLEPGRERYTVMLDDSATIIDDIIVFCVSEGSYVISTLFVEDMVRWFKAHAEGYDVSWKVITSEWHMFTVQGPKALEMVDELLDEPVDDLRFFSFRSNSIDGEPVWVNRAGFTGEKYGYEIYVAADKLAWLEGKLEEASPRFGAVKVDDIQMMAWTLPTEAGFYYMRDLWHTNPYEVGLEKGIDWGKDFVGKEALAAIRDAGAAREMVGFTMPEADTPVLGGCHGYAGDVVSVDGGEIGYVRKLNYSFVRDEPIGYLLVEKGRVKPGDVVTIKGRYEGIVCEVPFI